MNGNNSSVPHPFVGHSTVPPLGPPICYFGAVLGEDLPLVSPDYQPDYKSYRELKRG
jgi:hypothetical protein